MGIGFRNTSETLFHTKFLQLRQTTDPEGTGKWIYAHRPNVANVVVTVPVIHDETGDKIVFLEELRPPLIAEKKSIMTIGLPAGLVDNDGVDAETSEDAIKRELLEETGYKADNVKILNRNVASSPGMTDETFDIGIADINEDYLYKAPQSDGGVIFKRHKVAVSDVTNWLKEQEKKGKSISSQTMAALFAYSQQTGNSLNSKCNSNKN